MPTICAPSDGQPTNCPTHKEGSLKGEPRASESRYRALDIHRQDVVVGGLNERQEVVLTPRRVDFDRWEEWWPAHLTARDVVVLEATTHAWEVYDQLVGRVTRVVVAHSAAVKLLSNRRVKMDRLLVVGMVPEVWVPL